MPSTKNVPRPGTLDTGLRKISTAIDTATLEAISEVITSDISRLLASTSVRLFLRDQLTDELFSRGGGTREIRVAPDPSSIVGYAAMTRQRAFAWKGGLPDRHYVVAIPLLNGPDLLGVVELVHAPPRATIDEERLRVFTALCDSIARRIAALQKVTVRASPYDYLLAAEAITHEKLRDARDRAGRTGRSVEQVLLSDFAVDKTALGRSLAEHFQCRFVADPSTLRVAPDLVRQFSPSFLRTHAVLPVSRKGRAVDIVVVNPRNLTLLDDLARHLGGVELTVSVAVREDILAALDGMVPAAKPEPKPIEPPPWEPAEPAAAFVEIDEHETGDDSGTIRLVNDILHEGMEAGASDVHLEASPRGGLVVRFRVDGVCHDHKTIDDLVARAVVSRIKILSNLDIAEHRLPQDGKLRMNDSNGRRVDLRVAIMPTGDGHEDAVLRILPQTEAMPLERLGIATETLSRLRRSLEQPHGIILCVGPTGSGKTTTLHAALGALKGPEMKIWTAEDPIEITQDRVRQVQVNTKIGLTFERALRAFLRLDPDVIMIGEIRDRETADAAIEASLTGHLVLSTLHTNSAPETVTRLLEMGLDPFTFGDSLLAVLAQRLVRRICDSCRESYTPPADEFNALRSHFGDNARFDAMKVERKKLQLVRAAGCELCFNTGYRGRAGIHELLVVTPEIRKLVHARAESAAIRKAAIASGLWLLKQDGIRKVIEGRTDLKEVLATCVSEEQ
jgi:type II secretory ATPase GspE/PulE/Tfp pilus assembly ATPase PilB-like protein